MGLFGFTEIIVNLSKGETRDSITEKVGSIWPSRKELCKAAPAITRGTLLGSFLGILPGGGALLASFASYTLEKKVGGKNAILRLVKATLPVLPVRNLPTTQAPDELHSDAHARHSLQRYDGFDDRRADDSQHHAGTSGHEL